MTEIIMSIVELMNCFFTNEVLVHNTLVVLGAILVILVGYAILFPAKERVIEITTDKDIDIIIED